MKLYFFVLILFSIFFMGVAGQDEDEDSEPEPEPEGEPEPEIGKYHTREYHTLIPHLNTTLKCTKPEPILILRMLCVHI